MDFKKINRALYGGTFTKEKGTVFQVPPGSHGKPLAAHIPWLYTTRQLASYFLEYKGGSAFLGVERRVRALVENSRYCASRSHTLASFWLHWHWRQAL